jgi:site-specific DNA recombinase
VDRATFEAVQKQLKVRSRPRKTKHNHDFALTGLFKCGECGCGITAQFAKGNGGTYRYYRCSKKKDKKCLQGYLREDLMQNQLRDVLETVALPDGWAHKMLAQVEVWEKEEQKNLISFAQSLETQTKDTEEKLDKLINAFLEETIDKDSYLKKKEELIKLKTELLQKKSDFGQKGKFWVEPLKKCIESAHGVEKLVSSKDFCTEKSLLEKIGTNRILKDKKLRFDFAPPFNFVSKHKGMAGELGDKNKEGDEVNFTSSPVWWEILGSNQ